MPCSAADANLDPMTTVLIVDDHRGFRASARRLLERAGYLVVGEAGDGASAIAAAERLHPDLVLLDVQLPDLSGFEVTRLLNASPHHPLVVLVSSRDAGDYGGKIGRSGARGFIPKGELSASMIGSMVGLPR